MGAHCEGKNEASLHEGWAAPEASALSPHKTPGQRASGHRCAKRRPAARTNLSVSVMHGSPALVNRGAHRALPAAGAAYPRQPGVLHRLRENGACAPAAAKAQSVVRDMTHANRRSLSDTGEKRAKATGNRGRSKDIDGIRSMLVLDRKASVDNKEAFARVRRKLQTRASASPKKFARGMLATACAKSIQALAPSGLAPASCNIPFSLKFPGIIGHCKDANAVDVMRPSQTGTIV
eukprot:6212943-Pleurochrysis_carterae.AAC.3